MIHSELFLKAAADLLKTHRSAGRTPALITVSVQPWSKTNKSGTQHVGSELHIDSFTFTKSFRHLLMEPKWSIFTIYLLIGSPNTLKYEDLEPVE